MFFLSIKCVRGVKIRPKLFDSSRVKSNIRRD